MDKNTEEKILEKTQEASEHRESSLEETSEDVSPDHAVEQKKRDILELTRPDVLESEIEGKSEEKAEAMTARMEEYKKKMDRWSNM